MVQTNLIKEDSFIVTHAFMRTEHNLKGVELDVYAIIYGYTQDGENHCYYGTIDFLMQWTGASEKTIHNAINSLIKKGLLEKTIMGNQKVGNRCYYKANRSVKITDYPVKITDRYAKITDNNIDNNIVNNIDYECIKWNFPPKEIKSYDNFSFSFSILDKQIIKCMRLIGYDDSECINNAIKIVNYYYSRYMKTFDEEHPRLSEKAMCSMLERLVFGSDLTSDNDMDIDMYVDMIDKHFETYYGGSGTDYNICHFMTEEVRNNRFYETCY